ncbi:hypothetical protein HPB52_014745 [Rhipicephalus sanguineus]|uniref:Uncharacterized protein n=1 Tax=Rhipicephalus sanguineus TaxID=34632 RepID=A0A9D4PLP5_RHISA|nr:hypothetical protein HPB52_014745 [Rhipicephalus sanguineus]
MRADCKSTPLILGLDVCADCTNRASPPVDHHDWDNLSSARMARVGGGSRRKPSQGLAAVTTIKGCLSGCAIDYRRPCTSGEGRLCDIFTELPLWNEVFWHVRLELRELSPGQLSLVQEDLIWDPKRNVEERKQEATMLLCHLLMLHRCVISVKLNIGIIREHDQLVWDAMRQNSNLRKLEMWGSSYVDKTTSYRLIAVLPHLTELRELDLWSLDFGYASSKRLADYLASTRSLKTLIMTRQYFKWDHAIKVVRGLERNVTITTLSLGMPTVDKFWSSSHAMIAFFHDVSTLRTLNVNAESRHEDKVSRIIEPMLRNTTISEVNLIDFHINIGDIQLIAALLIENGTLKSLNFISCVYKHTPQDDADSCVTYTESFGYVSSRIYPWVVALTENNSLEELTLSLSWYDAEDWRSFFKALVSNASLKKINVCQFPRKDVAEIFRAMRETGVQGRFVGVHSMFNDAQLRGLSGPSNFVSRLTRPPSPRLNRCPGLLA